ncbi:MULTISPECIES: MFS transporter [Corynebacterium]|jgi:MFS family permease|uniref:Metabolite transport protein YjhB n=1 Tax=Corynebacterium provencense TaxID=1737425 RepID=A0A2Z3YQY4_9CORY|nr:MULTISPECIES: MFS transporter [Corynebacterium]AWT24874.1 Putative metabolite transport protein YjhB [Corynebacterium provencense]MCI1255861.1 MFS transporter [Corynebacterium provencense]
MSTTVTPKPEGIDLTSGEFPRIPVAEARRGATLAFFAWTLAVYDFILFGTLLPRIKESFGWSETTALLANTLVSVGVFIVVILVGMFVDRLGRRRGMMVTVGGAAVSSFLTGISTGMASLVGFRSLSGFGMAEQSVNATYLNEVLALTDSDKVRRHRGFIYSFVQTGWPIGALLAAAFIAVVNAVLGEGEWRWAFVIATVPALFVLLLRKGINETPQYRLHQYLDRLVKEGRGDEARVIADRFGLTLKSSSPFREIFSGKNRRNTIVLSLAWIANYFGISTTSVLGTTMLEGVKGVSPSYSLFIVIVSNLVAAAGYVFHGWFGDRIGRKKVVIMGWIMASVFWAAFVLGPGNLAFTLITYMGTLFFLLGPYAAILFYQAECFESHVRGTGSSFIAAMGQPGTVIASAILTGLVASGIGLGSAALWVGAGGMLVSGLLMFGAKHVETVKH